MISTNVPSKTEKDSNHLESAKRKPQGRKKRTKPTSKPNSPITEFPTSTASTTPSALSSSPPPPQSAPSTSTINNTVNKVTEQQLQISRLQNELTAKDEELNKKNLEIKDLKQNIDNLSKELENQSLFAKNAEKTVSRLIDDKTDLEKDMNILKIELEKALLLSRQTAVKYEGRLQELKDIIHQLRDYVLEAQSHLRESHSPFWVKFHDFWNGELNILLYFLFFLLFFCFFLDDASINSHILFSLLLKIKIKIGDHSKNMENWIPDSDTAECMMADCTTKFDLFNRRHHCRKYEKIPVSSCFPASRTFVSF